MKKLQNKKTGEIGVLNIFGGKYQVIADDMPLCGNSVLDEYDTLDALMQEWEDYEEPATFWYIDDYEVMCGKVGKDFDLECSIYTEKQVEELRAIGNYFETEKEAKKAVEKLKAWKRLSENRYLFGRLINLIYSLNLRSGEFTEHMDDINLLFGDDNERVEV